MISILILAACTSSKDSTTLSDVVQAAQDTPDIKLYTGKCVDTARTPRLEGPVMGATMCALDGAGIDECGTTSWIVDDDGSITLTPCSTDPKREAHWVVPVALK